MSSVNIIVGATRTGDIVLDENARPEGSSFAYRLRFGSHLAERDDQYDLTLMMTAEVFDALAKQVSALVLAKTIEEDRVAQQALDWRSTDWDSAPLDKPHRWAAGVARDDPAFYEDVNRTAALAVERYLTRYSQVAHTHPDLLQ